MSTHPSKKDIRNPDIVTQELKKGFQWTTNHSKLVMFGGLAFIVAGIGYSVYQYFADQAEEKAQEAFYKVEAEYQKLQDSSKKEAATKQTEKDVAKSKKDQAKKATEPTPPAVVDYEPVAQKFATVISENKGSRASILSFLDYAEIKSKSQKYDDIVKTADGLKLDNDLLSALALVEKGNAQANAKNCQQALSTWENVLKIKLAQSIYPEVHLQQALCYESLKDVAHAEENYNKVLAEAKDSSAAKSAEKYLRLLKTKVN